MAYDPQQSAIKRQEIRLNYRTLLTQVEEGKEQSKEGDLIDVGKRIDELFKDGRTTYCTCTIDNRS